MITKLTNAQIIKMSQYRDKWLSPGFDTSAINKDKIESHLQVINWRYTGRNIIKTVWCKSPIEYRHRRKDSIQHLKAQVIRKVFDKIRFNVWNKIHEVADDEVIPTSTFS